MKNDMRLRKNIAVSDSGFIFNPGTGDSFSTNPIGIKIINMLKEQKDDEAIKTAIVEEYNVEVASFEMDFNDFMNMLKTYQLTETNV
jgi:hypothetical protein